MKYYIMSQDTKIQNGIKFREFSGKKSEEFGIEHIGRIKNTVTMHVNDTEHTVYEEVIEAPCYMVSKRIYDVIHMFDPDVAFSNAVFSFKEREPQMYKILLTDRIDVLHESSEFNKDNSLKHLILDKEKIQGAHIFRIAGISPNYIVVSMAIAESILRRKCEGLCLTEVEIR